MKSISTTPEFRDLTEDEITKALDAFEAEDDGDDDNPIPPSDPVVAEVARLIAAYADRFDYYCETCPELPDDVLDYQPPTPIEQVAFDIFTDAVFDAFQEADEDGE